MKFLCMDCFEVYDAEINVLSEWYDGGKKCPKSNCSGLVFEIDEIILPTIELLNKKGYRTKYCCGGHRNSESLSIYIMFEKYPESLNNIRYSKLPNGFDLENKSHEANFCIRFVFDDIFVEDKYKTILAKNLELFEWAEGLADI